MARVNKRFIVALLGIPAHCADGAARAGSDRAARSIAGRWPARLTGTTGRHNGLAPWSGATPALARQTPLQNEASHQSGKTGPGHRQTRCGIGSCWEPDRRPDQQPDQQPDGLSARMTCCENCAPSDQDERLCLGGTPSPVRPRGQTPRGGSAMGRCREKIARLFSRPAPIANTHPASFRVAGSQGR
jgi:hypothetical protein